MARVVRPGGRVVVLEFTTPTRGALALFYRLWFDRVVPLLGTLVGGVTEVVSRLRPADGTSEPEVGLAAAYSYLPNSVKRFPAPEILAGEMSRAGIGEVGCLLTAGGIVAIHAGTVPPNGP
jgi:demethylmenaquinone methyltransferase/2-methoxy-6-polyprenyl-1,4-benzoquinol methylase